MSNILVVGSLAYDSIETLEGSAERTLGGSANYFSLAASTYSQVRVVGVVGEDYAAGDLEMLKSRGVDTSGLIQTQGKTFFWKGSYKEDLNEAKTLQTDLNVFEHFNPTLSENFRKSEFVFLANIDPVLQQQVLSQIERPRFVGSDTMNYWISSKKEELLKVLKKVDVLLINEGESKSLTQTSNAIAAAQKIFELGPKYVVIKRGEYGFVLYSKDGYFILPAFPIAKVVDPTGAGDTFAGGFFGYLSKHPDNISINTLKQACMHGSVWASFTIQGFGVTQLKKVKHLEVTERMAQYHKVIAHL